MKYWGIFDKHDELMKKRFHYGKPYIYTDKAFAEAMKPGILGETVKEVKITVVKKKGKK